MTVGNAVGEFSFTATSVTVSTSADGGASSQVNYEGTASGYVYRTNKAHVDCTTAANAPGYITPDDAPLTAVGRYGLKSYSP
jgi:hypothetical protein